MLLTSLQNQDSTFQIFCELFLSLDLLFLLHQGKRKEVKFEPINILLEELKFRKHLFFNKNVAKFDNRSNKMQQYLLQIKNLQQILLQNGSFLLFTSHLQHYLLQTKNLQQISIFFSLDVHILLHPLNRIFYSMSRMAIRKLKLFINQCH